MRDAVLKKNCYGKFYLSYGATKSKKEWKTMDGALRYAESKGDNVTGFDEEPVADWATNPNSDTYRCA
jgi:hypothetical protein